MAKNKEKLNLLVLISNADLNNVDPLLFCHCEAIFNGLKHFYRVAEIGCKSEYKIKTLKQYFVTTLSTTSFNIKNSTFLPQIIFMGL
jgi:hypothetical protein